MIAIRHLCDMVGNGGEMTAEITTNDKLKSQKRKEKPKN